MYANKTIIASLAFFTSVNAHRELYLLGEFNDFITTYDKGYFTESEYHKRFDIFSDNYLFIEQANNESNSYRLDLNEFADLTSDEFVARMNGYRHDSHLRKTSSCQKFESKVTYASLPESFDWRDQGAVTDVKNQGQCGSCWSFSSAGAMEGAWKIKSGDLVDLSEQQLIDCSKTYGNLGCNGGLMDSAFEYAIDTGMCLYDDAPYTAETGRCADVSSCKKEVFFDYCVDVTPANQQHLTEAVTAAPVSIAIEADTRTFQFYSSGVLTSDACGTNLDHGVLIVGYGEEDGTMYWTVKNSWGDSWGESGYVRIERSDSTDDDGICGIAMQPSYIV